MEIDADIQGAEWAPFGSGVSKAVSHGVADAKGRAVGSRVRIHERDGRFVVYVNAARDGESYGATSCYSADDLDAAKRLGDEKMASARKRALKRA